MPRRRAGPDPGDSRDRATFRTSPWPKLRQLSDHRQARSGY